MLLAQIEKSLKRAKTETQKIAVLVEYTGTRYSDEGLCKAYGVDFDKYRIVKEKLAILAVKKKHKDKIKNIKQAAAEKGIKISGKTIDKLQAFVANRVFDTGHSMGYTAEIFVDKASLARFIKQDTYAKTCKYRPTYGYAPIILTKKEAETIEDIEGLLTIKGEKHAARWLVSVGSKNNHKLVWQNGFCVGTSHGKTIDECIELERLKQQKAFENAKRNLKIFGIEHLQKIGACLPGIQAAAKSINIDLEKIGGIRVDFALELAKKAGVEKQFQSYLSRI